MVLSKTSEIRGTVPKLRLFATANNRKEHLPKKKNQQKPPKKQQYKTPQPQEYC